MPTYQSPGVYIEELASGSLPPGRIRSRPLRGAAEGRRPRGPRPTWTNEHSTVAFVGLTDSGPTDQAYYLSSIEHFLQIFGENPLRSPLPEAVRGFFANGGRSCYVVRIDGDRPDDFAGNLSDRTGLAALEGVPDVSTVCAPDVVWLHREGVFDLEAVRATQQAMIAHCEFVGGRVAILDPPASLGALQVREWRMDSARYDSMYAALYYPWVKVMSAGTGLLVLVPPCGHVAGAWAAVDRSLGPHASALGRTLKGVLDLETVTVRAERDVLNPEGVNVLGYEPGLGIAILGSRSLSGDPEWRSLHRRRLVNLLERNLAEGMSWVLRAGTPPMDLFAPVREHVEDLLFLLWRGGGLRGDIPDDAFSVRCDRENNPAESTDAGQVVAEVDAVTVDGHPLRLRVVHFLG